MGKVEILTLIAGVVLSIALALIVVPMFGDSKDFVLKQKLKFELIAFKNAILLAKENNNNSLIINKNSQKASLPSIEVLKDYLNGLEYSTTDPSFPFKSSIDGLNYGYGIIQLNDFKDNYIGINFTIDENSEAINILSNFDFLDKICINKNVGFPYKTSSFWCVLSN